MISRTLRSFVTNIVTVGALCAWLTPLTAAQTIRRGEATYTFESCQYTKKNVVQCKVMVTNSSRHNTPMMRIKPNVAKLVAPGGRTVYNDGEAEWYNEDRSPRKVSDPFMSGHSAFYLIDFMEVDPGMDSADVLIYNLAFRNVTVSPQEKR